MNSLRIVGKALISIGVGVLLFVGWTLWGTGFYTQREQNRVFDVWNAQPEFPGTGLGGDTDGGPQGPPANFEPGSGEGVFLLKIPAIDLNKGKGFMVVEGVGTEDLKKGPGHYPSCRPGFERPYCTEFDEVWPGEDGRVIVSGHRTTYLAPFWAINELRKGDEIITETKWGDFTYEVSETRIVQPNSLAIAIQNDEPEIVLTTCNPRFSASQRLIVFAKLVEGGTA